MSDDINVTFSDESPINVTWDIDSVSFTDISDISIVDLQDSQVLQYNSSTGNWENKDLDELSSIAWGQITGTLSDQTDLQNALDDKADSTTLTSHTGDSTIHFTEGNIDHTNIQNIGSNSHSQIDSHISDSSIHFSDLSSFDTDDLSEGTNKYFYNHDNSAHTETYLTDITGENIGSLNDVTISSASDNELMAYDSTSGGWINQTKSEAGFSTVASTGSYNDLSNQPSDVTDMSSYSTTDLSEGTNLYYTETRVSNNTDVSANTTHRSSNGTDHTYIDQDVTSGSSPNFSNTNMSGNNSVWTNDSGYITGITGESIRNLSDVQDVAPSDGYALIWNDTEGRYEPGEITGTSDVSELNDLSDVDTSGEADNKILKFNSGTGNFEIADDENTTYTSSDFDHNSLTNTHNLTTDIDHNQLTNYESAEHIDWSVSQTENIHSDNYTDTTYSASDFNHDDLSNIPANDHLDWTISQTENIHPDNYTDTNTEYTAGTGLSLSGTEFNNTDTGSSAVSSHESTYNHDNFLTDITSENFGDLSDVDTSGVSDSDVVSYNSTSGNYETNKISISNFKNSRIYISEANDAYLIWNNGNIEMYKNGEIVQRW